MPPVLTMTGELAHKLATGKKTLHVYPARHDADYRYRKCPFPHGDAIAVRRFGKDDDDPTVYAEVTASKIVTLGTLPHDDVLALGYARLFELQMSWIAQYDPATYLGDPAEVILRFSRRHSSRPVWRLSVKIADAPRLLTVAPDSKAGRGDYTVDSRLAMPDEPEAVSLEFQNTLSAAASARDEILRLAAAKGKDVRNAVRAASWRAKSDR